MNFSNVQQALKKWFLKNQRDLPWRKRRTPYRVWISEVMLQQTRAGVVVEFFEKWMKKFPTIEKLASSEKKEVIKTWEGLGYYSRARNIHIAAKEIVSKFHGKIPENSEDLKNIKGIGPYTLGAILSFAFGKKAPAIDANVVRVISRMFCIKEDVSLARIKKQMEKFVLKVLDSDAPSLIMEALIELGALVCKQKPLCDVCPIRSSCIAKKKSLELSIPYKKKKTKIEKISRAVFLCTYREDYLVFCESKSLMADLWHFPYMDFKGDFFSTDDVKKWLSENHFLANKIIAIKTFRQFFTSYDVTLYPFFIELTKLIHKKDFQRIKLSDLKELAFSSGHRKIVDYIEKNMGS